MFYIANYGTALSTAAVNALNSFVALGTTPGGQHLAKDGSGNFVNTADTGGVATITTQDEGVTLSSTVTTLNFVGAGVTASGAGATTTITIPGGSGLTIGSTGITSGTTTRVLYDNAGVLGEYTISGTGNVAMTTSPTFVTPTLGAASATSINSLTISTSTGTFTLTNAKVFSVTNTLTLSGTDGSTLNIGAGGTLGTAAFTNATAYEVPLTFSTGLTRTVNTITVNTSQNISTLSNLTSNGLVTTSGGTGALSITVPGTGVLTFITTPSSANLLAALTDKTGTGVNVFATSPTLVTPVLGVATATSLNGLTISATTGTFTLTNAKTLSVANTLSFAGTDSTTITFQGTDTYVGRATTDTLTNKTLTAARIASGGFLADANGNEQIIFTTTASAVNELTVVNAATGNAPAISATGGDTNIDLNIGAKGTGQVKHTTATFQDAVAASDGATITFDVSDGNTQTVTMGGNRTLAISNAKAGQWFVLRLLQDGTGTRVPTWFTTIKWAGGVAPTLTTTANKADTFLFFVTSAGNYDGYIVGQNV